MDLKQFDGQKVVFKFHADWCGPCKSLAPVVDKVSKDMNLVVVDVNIDEDIEFTSSVGVRSVPTLVAWNGSGFSDQMIGARPESVVREFFTKLQGAE